MNKNNTGDFIIQEKAGREVNRFEKIKLIGRVIPYKPGRIRGGLPVP